MTKKLSRRDFLKVTGVMSASLILSACGVKASEFPTATSLPSTSTPLPTITSTPLPVPTPTVEDLKMNGIVQKAVDKLVIEFNKKGITIAKEVLSQSGLKVVRINGIDENSMAKKYDVVITSASPSGEGGGYPVAMIDSENNSVEKININAILGMIGIDYDIIVAWDEEHKTAWEEFIKEADTIVPDSATQSKTMASYPDMINSYFRRTRNPDGTDKMNIRFNTCFVWSDITSDEKELSDPIKVEAVMKDRLRVRMQYKPKDINIILEPFDLLQDGTFNWSESTPWFKAFGKNWFIKAFQFASEVADELSLIPGKDINFCWNDTQLDKPSSKLDLTLEIIDKITQAGFPIHKIGLQIYNGDNFKLYPHKPKVEEMVESMRRLKKHIPQIYVEYGTWRDSPDLPNLIPVGAEILTACAIVNSEQPGTITSFGIWDEYNPDSNETTYDFYHKVTYEPNMNYYDLEKEMIRFLA